MTANTGRTTSAWSYFKVDNSAASFTQIPVDSCNGLGLDYEQVDLTAFQDAIKNALPGQPSNSITITGPVDTTATTGSHTVLAGLPGLTTPLALGFFIGIRHTWESGEPVFGITGTSANGYLCFSYTVDPSTMKYTAVFVPYPGSAVPAWGTTAVS